jgi:hypothetical protein
MAAAAARRPLRPFRQGTRRHWQRVLTIANPLTAAAPAVLNPVAMPKVGMLSAIWLLCSIAFTSPAAGDTLGTDGLAGMFSRIQLTANLGSAAIVDASGRGVEIASRMSRANGPRALVSGLGTGAQTATYALKVPVGANSGRNFELGLINLQDPQVQVFLNLQVNALNTIFPPINGAQTNVATSSSIDIFYEYYEIGDPTVFALPPRAIVRTLEDLATGLVVGDNVYLMPRLGTLLDYAQIIILNSLNASAANITSLKMRFNKTNVVEERSSQLSQAITDYGYDAVPTQLTGTVAPAYAEGPAGLQPGVFDYAFWSAEGINNSGDLRDAVDTEEITTTEFITTVAAGVAVQNTDTIRHVRRVVQVLP